MASSSAADRLLQRGLWALLAMWLLGLVSTLYLYVQPFLFAEAIQPGSCPARFDLCFQWLAEGGPDARAFVRAAPLLVAGVVLPIAWHRRAMASLSRHARAVLDPDQPGRYREAPGTVLRIANPERAARAALLRYADRLALALALLLPVYFVAWTEGSIVRCSHCYDASRTVPRPVDYLPLLALSTLLFVFHVPTRKRVLGPLGRSWEPGGRG